MGLPGTSELFSCAGQIWVQRSEGRAGFENTENADVKMRAFHHVYRDDILGRNAMLHQSVCDLVCLIIEAAITELSSPSATRTKVQCDRIRISNGIAFEGGVEKPPMRDAGDFHTVVGLCQ